MFSQFEVSISSAVQKVETVLSLRKRRENLSPAAILPEGSDMGGTGVGEGLGGSEGFPQDSGLPPPAKVYKIARKVIIRHILFNTLLNLCISCLFLQKNSGLLDK